MKNEKFINESRGIIVMLWNIHHHAALVHPSIDVTGNLSDIQEEVVLMLKLINDENFKNRNWLDR